MRRPFFIATALAVALILTWLAWDGWFYLQQGYSLEVALAGEPGSVFHIDFPPIRAGVHVFLWMAAMAAVGAYFAGSRWATTAAWLSFAAAIAVGVHDVGQYGTIGSPTSIWTLVLLLLFALLTKLGPPISRSAA